MTVTNAPHLADDTRNWADTYRINGRLKPGLSVRAATDSNYINGMSVALPAYGGTTVFANAICNILSPGQRIPGLLSWSVTESLSNITQTAQLEVLDALPISSTSAKITGFAVGTPSLQGAPSTITPVNYMPAQWCSTTIRYQWVQNGSGISTQLVGNHPISMFYDPTLAGNPYVQTFQEQNLQYRVFEPEIIVVDNISAFPNPMVPYTERDSAGGTTFNEWWDVGGFGDGAQMPVGAYYVLVDGIEVMRITKIDYANNYLYVIPGGRGAAGTITEHLVGGAVQLLGFKPFTGKWTALGYLMPQDFRTYQSPMRSGACFCSYEGYGDPGMYVGAGATGLSKTFNRANNMCFTGYWFVTSPQATVDDTGTPKLSVTLQSAGYVVNEQQINIDTIQRSQAVLGNWATTVFDEIGYTRAVPGSWLDYAQWDPSLPGSYPLGIMTEYGQNEAFFQHMQDSNMGTTCQECQNEYLDYIAQHEHGQATGSIAETRAVGKHVYQESIQVYNNGGTFNAGPLKTFGRLMTAMAIGSWDNPLEGNSLGTRWTKMPNALFNNMLNWTNGRVWNGQLGFEFSSETDSYDFSNQTHTDEFVYGLRVALKCPFQVTYDQQPWSQPGLDLASMNHMTYNFTREGYPIFIPVGKILRGLPNPANNAALGTNTPTGWFTDNYGNETCDMDVGHGNWHLAYGGSIDQYTHTIDPTGIYTLVYVSCQTAFGNEVQFTVPAAGTGIKPTQAFNEQTNEKLVWYSGKVGNKEGLQMTSGVQQTDSVTIDNLLLGLDWNTKPASWGLTLTRDANNNLQVDAQPPCPDPAPHLYYFNSPDSNRHPNTVQKIQKFVNFMIERRYIGPAVTDALGHIVYNYQIVESKVFDEPTAAGVIGVQQFMAQADNGVNTSQWPTTFQRDTSGAQPRYIFKMPNPNGGYQGYEYIDNEGQWGEATYQACHYWLQNNKEFIMTDVWWYVQNGLSWDQYVAAIVGLPIPQYQDAATDGKWAIDQIALDSEIEQWMKQYFKDAVNYGNSVVDDSINQATQKVIQTNFADPRIQMGDVIWAEVPGYMSNANRFGTSGNSSNTLNGIYVTDISRTMDLQNGTYSATYQGYRYAGNFENTVVVNPSNYCSTVNNAV